LKVKLKGHHFDTIKVMEGESQAVLNTLKEHEFVAPEFCFVQVSPQCVVKYFA
jgi:hypothetical protein